jgi:ABC-type polysaccharide/polyol phosphate transport system ATPase subunit
MLSETTIPVSDDIVISVHQLAKTYRLFSHPGDRIKQFLSLGLRQYHRGFTALQEVSFEVRKGETIGIIGRNGSGKSTLLQLICGILKPTAGTVWVNGRISALLELGAGFNPEFTGRENVYFQGALMGFTGAQIDARMANIAAFADIGEFIDQPVRTYSSGMFVRLAFAVASHVDPDIMVIDEALAVGDLVFQARCLARIRELKARGTTFLLVSHSMRQILEYADRALLLDGGKLIAYDSNVEAVIVDYEVRTRNVARSSAAGPNPLPGRTDLNEVRFGSAEAIISNIRISQNGSETTVLQPDLPTEISFHIEATRPFVSVVLGLSIRHAGTADLWGDNNQLAEQPISLHVGCNVIRYAFTLPLTNGEYLLYCGLADIDGGRRIELDQRWPAEKITIFSSRHQLGYVHGPITVHVES